MLAESCSLTCDVVKDMLLLLLILVDDASCNLCQVVYLQNKYSLTVDLV